MKIGYATFLRDKCFLLQGNFTALFNCHWHSSWRTIFLEILKDLENYNAIQGLVCACVCVCEPTNSHKTKGSSATFSGFEHRKQALRKHLLVNKSNLCDWKAVRPVAHHTSLLGSLSSSRNVT